MQKSLDLRFALILYFTGEKETGWDSYTYLQINDKDKRKLSSVFWLEMRKAKLDRRHYQIKSQEKEA